MDGGGVQWETAPGLDPAPIHSQYLGLGAVPVWFVRTEDYLAARADGVLTIGELEALDPLMEHARLFSQIQHPSPPAENDLLLINATGTLQDGRSFRLHWTHQARKRENAAFAGLSQCAEEDSNLHPVSLDYDLNLVTRVSCPSRSRQIVRSVRESGRYGRIGRSGCCHECCHEPAPGA
jgi:hypothetical protein